MCSSTLHVSGGQGPHQHARPSGLVRPVLRVVAAFLQALRLQPVHRVGVVDGCPHAEVALQSIARANGVTGKQSQRFSMKDSDR